MKCNLKTPERISCLRQNAESGLSTVNFTDRFTSASQRSTLYRTHLFDEMSSKNFTNGFIRLMTTRRHILKSSLVLTTLGLFRETAFANGNDSNAGKSTQLAPPPDLFDSQALDLDLGQAAHARSGAAAIRRTQQITVLERRRDD
jgi:hypothetical protein